MSTLCIDGTKRGKLTDEGTIESFKQECLQALHNLASKKENPIVVELKNLQIDFIPSISRELCHLESNIDILSLCELSAEAIMSIMKELLSQVENYQDSMLTFSQKPSRVSKLVFHDNNLTQSELKVIYDLCLALKNDFILELPAGWKSVFTLFDKQKSSSRQVKARLQEELI